MDYRLTNHGFTMWTTTLSPLAVGRGHLEADATFG
jgi:hypothetical protein